MKKYRRKTREMQAKVLSVIEIKCSRGAGSKMNPVRNVSEYWSFDGEKLAENDPFKTDPRIKRENLTTCSNCGREVDKNWKYCPKCGKDICQKS